VLGTTAGSQTAQASVGGLTGSPVDFTATATAGAPTQIAAGAGDGQSSIAGTAVGVVPSVIVTDSYGNVVSGVSVEFTVTSGGGSVTGAVAVTDASGVAAVGSWTLGSAAGLNTLDASVAGITGVVTFEATGVSDAASQMVLVGGDAQEDTVAATLAEPYSVRIVDNLSNPVPGIPVTWTVTGGGGSITASSVTDADGVATAVRVLGTGAGVQTAEASVGGLAGSPQLFSATATAGAPALGTLNDGDGQSATVGTSVAMAPSVKVTDQFDNPVSGVAVVFAVTQNNGSVTGEAQVTDGDGIARVGAWQVGTATGANGLSATPSGLAAIAFTATGTADVADQIVINAGDLQDGTVAGSPVAIQPSVVVRDQYGNVVAGDTVRFTVTQGGGAVTGATPTSLASGIATVGSWTMGPIVGTNELIATVSGVADTVAFTATSVAGAAASMALEEGTAQTDTIGATLPTPYSVRVVDANGNAVEGTSVTWSVAGGGSITPSSDTDASGIATATRVLGTTAGSQTAQASVGGLTGSPVDFTATATAGAPTQIAAGAGTTPQTATVATAVGVVPSVIVTDRAGNPVAGVAVTFSVTGGDGVVAPTSAMSTLADGTATVTSWTLGTTAGTSNNTLQALATGAGIAGNPATFTATATAGSPATIVRVAGDSLTTITGTSIPTSPSVRVEDTYGNAVPGVVVTFTPSVPGSVGTASDSTNAAGVATTSWTVRAKALGDAGYSLPDDGRFVNTLSATAAGGSSPSTQFTGYANYSFDTHVNGIWASSTSSLGGGPISCTACHAGASGINGLTFDTPGSAEANYSLLVGVSSGTLCSSLVRISNAGGASGESASLLLQFAGSLARGFSPPAGCSHDTKLSDANTEILRAWVRNAVPNN
jgi:adhesin/invasin